MIEYLDARALVLGAAKALSSESVPLARALGRTLARDIRAREDIPPFTKSTMDGCCGPGRRYPPVRDQGLRSRSNSRFWPTSPPAEIARKAVGPGQAVRIMTGAPLPAGADAVVMVEHTESHERTVRIRRGVRPGDNIGLAGEDLKRRDRARAGGRSSARPSRACWPRPDWPECR